MKAKCKQCGDIIESKKTTEHPHDLAQCKCGLSWIDDIGCGLGRCGGDIEWLLDKEEQP